jgi:hypothetical protein
MDNTEKFATGAGAAGGLTALFSGIATLGGFTSSGIAAGSVAAGVQAADVAAGSAFALAQAAGATGFISTVGLAGLAVAAVGLGAYFAYQWLK